MWYLAFAVFRLLVTGFFLLTSTYCILNYSHFAFYLFIRPRVFSWVNQFVAWHHVWYWGAYLLSVISLLPDLLPRKAGGRSARLTRRLALAFVLVFGLVGEWLVVTPYLPKLWNDGRSFIAALLSFLPIVWLALIDHAAAWPGGLQDDDDSDDNGSNVQRTAVDRSIGPKDAGPIEVPAAGATTDQRRTLAACLWTAIYLWGVHLLGAWLRSSGDARVISWTFGACWALTLNVMAAMLFYAAINGLVSLAGVTRRPRASEYAIGVALAAVAIATLLMKVVFPTIAFGDREPLALALVAGMSLALAWSGVALRRTRWGRWRAGGIDTLVAPIIPGWTPWSCSLALVVLPLATFAAISAVERADWNFLVQKTIVVVEWALAFGLIFSVTGRMTPAAWSPVRAVAPPVLAALILVAVARVSPQVSAWTGDSHQVVDVSLDDHASRDISFSLLYDVLVKHAGRDATFSRYLQVNSSVPTTLDLTPPDVRFSPRLSMTPGPRPHIFLFVLDSLRRDYLSVFNPAVTFSPNIARFAADSFAFQNAFTPYGGTALALPAIWSGGMLLHRLYMPEFQRSNALEKLLDAEQYRWYMSLDTVMAPLISSHPDLVQLDREREVMQFDFCRTLGELEEKLDTRTDGRPVFAFTLPQNLHISVRQHAAVPPGEHYPGFFEPYAAEVHRIDACFGDFLSYLRQNRLYDDSVVILTTDHGDSLGEGGNWGHGVSLHPEVVRIPLIVHIPSRTKPLVTTDLTRVAFSTDIVPTLYELLGHRTQDLGPLYGSPLFVAPDAELLPRRRGSFLLASSYGPTWGILRRNGRSLYIADLVNGREYGYNLTRQPIGERTPVTDEEQRISQRWIRERIAELARAYRFNPEP